MGRMRAAHCDGVWSWKRTVKRTRQVRGPAEVEDRRDAASMGRGVSSSTREHQVAQSAQPPVPCDGLGCTMTSLVAVLLTCSRLRAPTNFGVMLQRAAKAACHQHTRIAVRPNASDEKREELAALHWEESRAAAAVSSGTQHGC
jgi:hypothetical protein